MLPCLILCGVAMVSYVYCSTAPFSKQSQQLAKMETTELHSFLADVGISDTPQQYLSDIGVSEETLFSVNGSRSDGSNTSLEGRSSTPGRLTQPVCITLQKALGQGKVDTLPLEQASVEENWSQSCIQTPTCIVHPTDSSDVSKAMKVVKFFQQTFAVRSGGHSPNPGFSSVYQPGILLSMDKLDQITLSKDNTIASVGPGQRWINVYEALEKSGVYVIGGRIPQVGVGGLILGGGYFHFSGQFGTSADNVKSFEVVLADGKVVNANKQQNADLFWALKGGGPNFGIVTRFDLNTIPSSGIWYTVLVFIADNADLLLDRFVQWQNNGGAIDVKGTVALQIGLDVITLGLIYSEPVEKPPAFAPFYDLQPLVTAVPSTTGTVLSLTRVIESTFDPTPQRHDYRGVSSKIDAQLYKDVHAHWRKQALITRNTTKQTFTLQPIPASLAKASKTSGGNPMGIPEINHQWWTTLIDWKEAAADVEARSASISTTAKWKELSTARGLDVRFEYMNDASRDQNPLRSYGEDNLAKLREIAKKYDPLEVFQKLQNDGFLVSKA